MLIGRRPIFTNITSAIIFSFSTYKIFLTCFFTHSIGLSGVFSHLRMHKDNNIWSNWSTEHCWQSDIALCCLPFISIHSYKRPCCLKLKTFLLTKWTFIRKYVEEQYKCPQWQRSFILLFYITKRWYIYIQNSKGFSRCWMNGIFMSNLNLTSKLGSSTP